MTDARHFLGMEERDDPRTGASTWCRSSPPRATSSSAGAAWGAALVALEAASGRPTVWSTCQYLSFAPTGSVLDLTVTLAAVGSG